MRGFWKASAISLACYAAAVLLGFLVDFRVTGFAVPALAITWTLFCVLRAVQLRGCTLDCDRESYSFALGGCASSVAALVAITVLTQVV